jgi:hypothetical protein
MIKEWGQPHHHLSGHSEDDNREFGNIQHADETYCGCTQILEDPASVKISVAKELK